MYTPYRSHHNGNCVEEHPTMGRMEITNHKNADSSHNITIQGIKCNTIEGQGYHTELSP